MITKKVVCLILKRDEKFHTSKEEKKKFGDVMMKTVKSLPDVCGSDVSLEAGSLNQTLILKVLKT